MAGGGQTRVRLGEMVDDLHVGPFGSRELIGVTATSASQQMLPAPGAVDFGRLVVLWTDDMGDSCCGQVSASGFEAL